MQHGLWATDDWEHDRNLYFMETAPEAYKFFTRYHSWAGPLTCLLYERLRGTAEVAVLPATGTPAPMSDAERPLTVVIAKGSLGSAG